MSAATEGAGRLETVLLERQAHYRRGAGIPAATPVRAPVVAVAMAENEEVIRCIAEAQARGIADFVLFGNRDAIEAVAARAGVTVKGARFLAESDPVAACERAAQMAAEGQANLLMKGLVQTADFMRAVLGSRAGLLPEGRLLSHVALFDVPAYHKLLILTDAAICPVPDAEQKRSILENAVRVARAIGIAVPKIACVAPAEKENSRIPSTLDAALLREQAASGGLDNYLGSVELDGPFGFDVAVSKEAAQTKGIAGPVAGDADILLMPNLDAANAVYKSLTYFAGAEVAGVVMGARIPIILTSRADSERSKYLSVLLALTGA